MYHIKARDVTIDLPGREVIISDFELIPDTPHLMKLKKDLNLPDVLLKIKIARMKLTGIGWARLLTDKVLSCDSILVDDPVVRIQKTDTAAQGPDDKKTTDSKFQAILVSKILVKNPDIGFSGQGPKGPSFEAKGGTISLTDWRFDLNQPGDSTRLFYATHTAFQLNTFRVHHKDALYRIGSGAISFDSKNSSIQISDLQVKPAISKAAFYKLSGFQKEIYEAVFPSVELTQVDWRRLIYHQELIAGRGRISNATLGIYMDRIPPPNPENKNGKFPHQMLMKLKLPVYIPVIEVHNGQFAYTEKNHKTKQEGVVSMHTINGTIRHLTNIHTQIRRDSVCSIQLKGIFKGSNIDALFRFMLNSRNGSFSVDGGLSRMDGKQLNTITRPLALAEVRELDLDKVSFHIDGNQAGAKADMTMLYKNLKVNLLEVEDDGLDKKDFMSFLANHLLTYHANPMPGKEVRKVHVTARRDDKKSFFNLIWKTIFTGVLQTAGRGPVKIDKMVNKRIEKQDAERRENEPAKPLKK